LHATHELTEIKQVTEEKHMYDSREKAALDLESGLIDAREEGREQGREQGREEGEIKGEIKLIRTLQEILNVPLSEESELKDKSLDFLQQIAADLRTQLRNRS
jgi:flagellar biosynthesis/type III secretory pathway protein FliH